MINAKPEEARAWAKQAGVRFPLLPDPERMIIGAYRAERSVYTTLIAPDGKIVKTYPGYGREMLQELSDRIARICGKPSQTAAFDTAPKKLVSGCPF